MRRYKKIVGLVMAFAAMVGAMTGSLIDAKADIVWPGGPEIEGTSAIVMDMNSGTILYEKNVHDKKYPASITKILTSLIGIEECKLEERVFFSHDAVYKNEGNTSHIARDYREELSVKSTVYAIMLESANECAYALAEHVAAKYNQQYDYFMKLMNEKAHLLGCKDSNFNNANGLPDENHYTSAYDMALIAAEAYRNETFRLIVSTNAYTITDSSKDRPDYNCYNHHLMMRKSNKNYYEYVTGGKTGYTSAARNTLVTYAEKDGMSLVCVVMDCPKPAYEDTRNLLEYCFENFKIHSVEENSKQLLSQEMANMGFLNNNDPYVGFGNSSYIILPIGAELSDTKYEILDGNGKEIIARFQYTYGEHIVGNLNLKKMDAEVTDNYFQREEQETNIKVVKIKPVYIYVAVVAFLLLLMILHYLILFAKNYYIIRHSFEERKKQKRKAKAARRYEKRRKNSNLKFK